MRYGLPDPRRRLRSQKRKGARRISVTRSTVTEYPGKSPDPRSGQLAGPGCTATFRILGAGSSIRAPGISLKPGSGQLVGPGCAATFPDPRRRQLSQDRQEVLRIFGTGRTVRAPGGFPKPRSRYLASPWCAAASRIPRRQHCQNSQGDPRSLGSGQLAGPECATASRIFGTCRTARAPRRVSEDQEQATRPPGCAAALRIFAARL